MVDQGTQYIEEATLGRLRLDDTRTGLFVTKMDLGHPTVRAVSVDRVGASGALDDTEFHGPRAVSLDMVCAGSDDGTVSRRDNLARLRAFTSPSRRPVLVWADDDGIERRVRLRGDAAPLVFDRAPGSIGIPVQLTFVAPDGVLETVEEVTKDVPAVTAPGPGISHPIRLPTRFPRSTTFNTTTVVNGAVDQNERAPGVYRLWGPCSGPVLRNLTTGQSISLPGLVLTAQQYAEVDVAAATIRMNGRAAESLYAYQAWGVSVFPWLAPGPNLLRYSPTTFADGARASVAFRPRTI